MELFILTTELEYQSFVSLEFKVQDLKTCGILLTTNNLSQDLIHNALMREAIYRVSFRVMFTVAMQVAGQPNVRQDAASWAAPATITSQPSHSWGKKEVSFQDAEAGTGKGKAGWEKIQFCAKQAAAAGLQYGHRRISQIFMEQQFIDRKPII